MKGSASRSFHILRCGSPTWTTPPQPMGLCRRKTGQDGIGSKGPVKDLVVVLERPCFFMPPLSPVVAVSWYSTAQRAVGTYIHITCAEIWGNDSGPGPVPGVA
jgi:hypothetical protein